MLNIKFNYRYRDGSNYKKHGSAIFANPTNIELQELERQIKSKLIDDVWFYADEWDIPELFFDHCDFRIDPTWHEFEYLDFTDEPFTEPVVPIAKLFVARNL